jgi:hypothetical protein
MILQVRLLCVDITNTSWLAEPRDVQYPLWLVDWLKLCPNPGAGELARRQPANRPVPPLRTSPYGSGLTSTSATKSLVEDLALEILSPK